jgi:hypothetical protein
MIRRAIQTLMIDALRDPEDSSTLIAVRDEISRCAKPLTRSAFRMRS